jgi:hypothetical protein
MRSPYLDHFQLLPDALGDGIIRLGRAGPRVGPAISGPWAKEELSFYGYSRNAQ